MFDSSIVTLSGRPVHESRVLVFRPLDFRAAAVQFPQLLAREEAVALLGLNASLTVTLVNPARVTEPGVPKQNLATEPFCGVTASLEPGCS